MITMPAPSLKKLYLASSITELDKKISIEKRLLKESTTKLRNAADKLYQSAEKCNLDRDEEKAYVQYMKLVELYLFMVRERSEVTKEPKYNIKQLKSSANSALEKAAEIKNSLLKRYGVQQEALQAKKKETNLENSVPSDKKKDVEQSPSSENIANDPRNFVKNTTLKEYITSSDLYSMIRDPTASVIIMDVRPEKDFERSRMKYSRCVNIPQEILVKGITAFMLEGKLPAASLSKWADRSNADYVVLVDSETSSDSLNFESPLCILRDAIFKWDTKCKLKATPVVLAGGYKDWMLKYPMFTTEVISFLEIDVRARSTDFSSISYPNLDDDEPPKTANGSREENLNCTYPVDKLLPDKITNGLFTDISTVSKNVPEPFLDDHKNKLQTDVQDSLISKFSALSNKETINDSQRLMPTSNSISKQNVKNIPVINRSLKPCRTSKSETETYDASKSTVSDQIKTEDDLASEKEIAERERNFIQFRLRKEYEIEETKRLELQKREEELMEHIKLLDGNMQERDKQILAIKEDNEKMKKLIDKKGEDFEAKLKEKERLLEVEKLRHLRKTKEMESKMGTDVKKTNVSTSQPDLPKDLQQVPPKVKNIEPGGVPGKDPKVQVKHLTEREYNVPLAKEHSGRGLTRSHSFHNIVQTVAQEEKGITTWKIPTVDRSLKPVPRDYTPSISDEVSIIRQRNLKPIYGCPGIPLTGLRNLGNTCFMNAAIQCLSNTKPLAEYFDNNKYRLHINRENSQGPRGEVAEEFAVVIKALWYGQYKSITPTDFKSTVSRYLPVCVGHEQQDSHEFLVDLMDKLHGDLKQKCVSKPFPNLDPLPENEAKEVFWNYHKSQNLSKISDLFEGLLKSMLTCLHCGKTSSSFEVFSCLSLPIPFSRCSLQDCLKCFMKPEKMCGEGAWDCPKCRQKREAQKQMSISHLPEILIIQLKRFSYEGLWRSKLQTFVDFETRFDLQCMATSGPKFKVYNLYGIVNHIGTLEGGHYTSYCRNYQNDKWYKFDDHEVTKMSSSDIKTSDAYLLFYTSLESSAVK